MDLKMMRKSRRQKMRLSDLSQVFRIGQLAFKSMALTFLVFAVFALTVSGVAWAETTVSAKTSKPAAQTEGENSPRFVIEQIIEKSSAKGIAKDVTKQGATNQHIDFPKMAKKALGGMAKKISNTEKKWFEDTLQEIIVLTVYPKAEDFFSGVKIEYKKEKLNGDKAVVVSQVKKRGEPTDVAYSLQKEKGTWRVVDISIDGESWVETINEEIEEVLEDRKWAGLKKRMNDRVKTLRAQ